jgi:hypothetical protein
VVAGKEFVLKVNAKKIKHISNHMNGIQGKNTAARSIIDLIKT